MPSIFIIDDLFIRILVICPPLLVSRLLLRIHFIFVMCIIYIYIYTYIYTHTYIYICLFVYLYVYHQIYLIRSLSGCSYRYGFFYAGCQTYNASRTRRDPKILDGVEVTCLAPGALCNDSKSMAKVVTANDVLELCGGCVTKASKELLENMAARTFGACEGLGFRV